MLLHSVVCILAYIAILRFTKRKLNQLGITNFDDKAFMYYGDNEYIFINPKHL